MRVLITGIDGYTGWPLAIHLLFRGHEVAGIDNFTRRKLVDKNESQSATPILSMSDRIDAVKEETGKEIDFFKGSLTNTSFVYSVIRKWKPDTIVYLGQIPSAPFSMSNVRNAVFTQQNNIVGHLNTLYAIKEIVPDCHMVKLGTMGEFKLGNLVIPEGDYEEVEFRGRKDSIPAAKQSISYYHNSKIFDTYNLEMACRFWNIKASECMQGIIYGTSIPEMNNNKKLLTRFDFDEQFGTVINRFVAQAIIGSPLTIYGSGKQQRGLLPLKDSIQCMTLLIENPPQPGEHRIVNQFEEHFSINELADKVKKIGKEFNLDVEISHIDNPRKETEEHYYNPDHQKLFDLGYVPTNDIEGQIRQMFTDLIPYKSRIEECKEANFPKSYWHK